MRAKTAERVFMFVIAFFSVSLMAGCSLEKRPEYRGGYLYYPPALVNADRALDEARAAGKDKECPNEFNALKDQVDRAYDLYMACNDQGAIDMANDAAAKIKALCPRKPVAEVKPAPKPVPPPAPKPEPKPEPAPPAPAAEPERAKITLEDIHFDFNKATLTKEARSILDSNIKIMQDNPGIKVQIEGHACAHGTDNYNMALGERRANAVKEYLAKHGISADRLTTISYGETRVLCAEEPTPKNKNSECMKSNRRVHFEVI